MGTFCWFGFFCHDVFQEGGGLPEGKASLSLATQSSTRIGLNFCFRRRRQLMTRIVIVVWECVGSLRPPIYSSTSCMQSPFSSSFKVILLPTLPPRVPPRFFLFFFLFFIAAALLLFPPHLFLAFLHCCRSSSLLFSSLLFSLLAPSSSLSPQTSGAGGAFGLRCKLQDISAQSQGLHASKPGRDV